MVKIIETYFDCEDDSKSKMAIFTSDLPDPVLELDEAIEQYVKNETYIEFIDTNMNNPWVRVVMSIKSNLKMEDFYPKYSRDGKINQILK